MYKNTENTSLAEAIAALTDGATMTIMPGEHDVTATRDEGTYGSGFIIDEDNVTIKAADPTDKPVIYGFTNKYSAGVGDGGINGQDTIYVSGKNVTLENLVIMPLGGYNGGDGNTYATKTVEVTSTATGFKMTGCVTTPNTKTKDNVALDNADMTKSGNIHVSIDDAEISSNSFGEGATISAGWKGSSAADTYSVDVSGNYWGEGVTGADLADKIDGNVVIDAYYTNAEMTASATVGGIPVSDGAQLRAAVVAAKENDTIVVYPGDYDIVPAAEPSVQGQGNWYLPITADGVTIKGVDENGNEITDAMNTKATIYSTTETANGMWASQNLIAVFGDNVTISGVTIMPKVQVNKTVEVNGKNFTIQYCSIVPNTKVTEGQYADANDGGSLYFAGDKGNEVVKDNYFKQMVLSFDSVDTAESIIVEDNVFDTPYDADTQMISNVTWSSPATLEMADVTITGNTFKNLPEGYDKLVLQRMEGKFILEDNSLVKADGTEDGRDIADMVSFDDRFFADWAAFVAAEPTIVITENGATRVLQPAAEEEDPVVVKTLALSPSSAEIYLGDSVTITATLTGFADGATVSWTVNGTAATGSGNSLTVRGTAVGEYKVTATADGVSALAVINVVERPYTPPTGYDSGSVGGVTTYAVTAPSYVAHGTVRVSPTRASSGATVTVTVTPDKGYELGRLTVTDAGGRAVALTKISGTQYTFTMPASNVEVAATFTELLSGNPFDDIYAGDYYYDAVLWAVENGVTNGTGESAFSPNVTVSRAQMATFLWRAYGSPKASGENPFTDVSAGDYYYDAVLWAVSKGITVGTTDTTFSPDAPVTRAQAVTFLYRELA